MSFLISIEGFDGTGKTTQSKLLHNNLSKMGIKSFLVREPGGTPLGELLRNELQNDGHFDPKAELLLFEAARSELVNKVIIPKLNSGCIVISDRFHDSTIAYQGYGRGISISAIERLNKLSSNEVVPKITFLLDLEVEEALKRTTKRVKNTKTAKLTQFETESIEFQKKVRNGFIEIAKHNRQRIKVIESTKSIPDIAEIILNDVVKLFNR